MASGKSAYLRNATLNGVLGGTAFSLPSIVYVCLSTGTWTSAATGSSMSEVSGGSYSRVAMTNNTTNWPTSTVAVKSNGTVVTFATASGSWGSVTSFYITDSSSGGNVLFGGDLTTARAIASGDTASFAIGAISITEN